MNLEGKDCTPVEPVGEGVERVILLGSDNPDLPLAQIQHAIETLAVHDVVLGPIEDGDYYLVGACRRVPPIFGSMPWSSPDLWQATVDILRSANMSYATLIPWYDVDQQADYHLLVAQIAGSEDVHLARLHAQLAADNLLP